MAGTRGVPHNIITARPNFNPGHGKWQQLFIELLGEWENGHLCLDEASGHAPGFDRKSSLENHVDNNYQYKIEEDPH